MAKNESKTLNESLEECIDPRINESLENLRGLGIDSELFFQFKKRVELIISKNPGVEELVVSELGKAQISAEKLLEGYKRKFRSILDRAANDSL